MKLLKEILIAGLTWPIWIIIRLAGIISGLVVVPIALLFRTEKPVSNPEEQAYPSRKEVHLPKWAWLWDNDAEGMMSWMDEWPEMCWDKDPTSFLSMFQWAAIRNPANNMRFVRGLAIYLPEAGSFEMWGKERVSDKDYKNGKGWQFVKCKGKYFPYYGFYWVGEKYYCRFGHKFDADNFAPDYIANAPDRKLWKGMTFRPFQKRRDNSVYQVNQ